MKYDMKKFADQFELKSIMDFNYIAKLENQRKKQFILYHKPLINACDLKMINANLKSFENSHDFSSHLNRDDCSFSDPISKEC